MAVAWLHSDAGLSGLFKSVSSTTFGSASQHGTEFSPPPFPQSPPPRPPIVTSSETVLYVPKRQRTRRYQFSIGCRWSQ